MCWVCVTFEKATAAVDENEISIWKTEVILVSSNVNCVSSVQKKEKKLKS